jgi:hypothetical protein
MREAVLGLVGRVRSQRQERERQRKTENGRILRRKSGAEKEIWHGRQKKAGRKVVGK